MGAAVGDRAEGPCPRCPSGPLRTQCHSRDPNPGPRPSGNSQHLKQGWTEPRRNQGLSEC